MKAKEKRALNLTLSIDQIGKIFEWGIDYGQFLMEQERDSEDLFDAALCSVYSKKMSMPSQQATRRQPHTQKWREVKAGGFKKFMSFICKKVKELEDKGS